MIPPDVMDSILRRVSLVDLMSQSVVLKKSGHSYSGLCPFHNDRKNPSLSVSEEKGLYHCFSCGAKGNALTYLKEHDKLDFIESMRALAKMAGVDIEPYLKEGSELLPLRERLKTMHKAAQQHFTACLYNPHESSARKAAEILRRRRMDRKTAEKFGLGFGGPSPDALFRLLQGQGFKPDEILESGLCGKTDQNRWFDRFARRITFPVWDESGVLIAFGGRAIDDKTRAKYINSPETPLFKKSTVLYGWNLAKEEALKSRKILLVEGYMDVIRLFQAGFGFAAAPMGTSLSEDRVSALKNKMDCLYFCFDGDAAGVKSAFRASGLAAKTGVKAKVVIFPPEDDPDTFLLTRGARAFSGLLEEAVDSETFVMNRALELLPDVPAFLQMVFEYALSLEGETPGQALSVQTDAFLRRCAEQAQTSFSSVELDFQRFKDASMRSRLFPAEEKRGAAPSEDRLLAALLMVYPELADTLAEIAGPDDFSDEESRAAVQQIFLHPEKTAQDWLAYWGSSSLVEEAALCVEMPDVRIVKTYALRLRIKSLSQKIEGMSQALVREEANEELLRRIEELQKEKLDLKENFYKL